MKRSGLVLLELTGTLAGLALFSAVVVAALSGARQRAQVEAQSARLETAQNLLARWRAGHAVEQKEMPAGWTRELRPASAGMEMLTLRAAGVTLSTVRLPIPQVQAAQ